ncbi:hypothetical protein [uncultured Desulfuromusa sp.]|uniref:hypothetical protein n=1 Tax=uncultured Desulfuromusa sp. TaxID=219183 RepID=UPI003747A2A0
MIRLFWIREYQLAGNGCEVALIGGTVVDCDPVVNFTGNPHFCLVAKAFRDGKIQVS